MKHALHFTCLFILAGAAALAGPPINTNWRGLAIDGYDPVAYFDEGRPIKGEKTYTYQWADATWRFSSQEHLERFRQDPERYAPQYGGYCAWAAAKGKKANGDPEVWALVDGKLYLNYDEDIKAEWEKDIPGFIEAADAKWPL